jgi:hypothetical protein
VRLLLNRAAEPFPIPPKQIEGALGHPIHHTFPSDYKTVSTALNSGVPLALSGDTDLASQFDSFTRGILGTPAGNGTEARAAVRLCSISSALHRSGKDYERSAAVSDTGRRPFPARDRGAAGSEPVPPGGDHGRGPRPVLHPSAQPRQQYLQLRAGVHRKLLNRLNLEALAQADRPRAEAEIRTLLLELLGEEGTPLSLGERETLIVEILDDVFGLGPLEPLLRDPTISDILVNTCKNVFVERMAASNASRRTSRTTSI